MRKNGAGTSYQIWQLIACGRQYSVVGAPDTLASGRPVTVLPIWRNSAGQQVGAGCDEHYCIATLQVQLLDAFSEIVGTSPLIPVSGGGSGLRTFLASKSLPATMRVRRATPPSTRTP